MTVVAGVLGETLCVCARPYCRLGDGRVLGVAVRDELDEPEQDYKTDCSPDPPTPPAARRRSRRRRPVRHRLRGVAGGSVMGRTILRGLGSGIGLSSLLSAANYERLLSIVDEGSRWRALASVGVQEWRPSCCLGKRNETCHLEAPEPLATALVGARRILREATRTRRTRGREAKNELGRGSSSR